MPTVVHLVRHGEVENPGNIWYGRMEGFVLSERGQRQAKALGQFFGERSIQAIYASPLTRALQTAAPIGEATGLEVTVDERIIESMTKLEGKPGDFRMFVNPLVLRYFLLPTRPSWGEPYRQIRERVTAAVMEMASRHEGGEVVAVSHMTPVLVARLWADGNPKTPWRAGLPCRPASVTSLEFDRGRCVGTRYRDVGGEIV